MNPYQRPPRIRRILIPLVAAGLALGVILVAVLTPPRQRPPTSSTATPTPQSTATKSNEPSAQAQLPPPSEGGGQGVGETPDPTETATPSSLTSRDREEAVAPSPTSPDREGAVASSLPAQADIPTFTTLRAVAPTYLAPDHKPGDSLLTDQPDPALPARIGSLVPSEAPLELVFSRTGAGITSITPSNIWKTAASHRDAEAYYRDLAQGRTPRRPLPPDSQRYVIAQSQALATDLLADPLTIPSFAANSIRVLDQNVPLFEHSRDAAGNRQSVWAELAPGSFQTVVIDDNIRPVLRITRTFTLGSDYDIHLKQHIENLTSHRLTIQWRQYGPTDLKQDSTDYIDVSRYRFGYLLDTRSDPQRQFVFSDDGDLIYSRNEVIKLATNSNRFVLWPNETSQEKFLDLSWFASTNRYFAVAVHPDSPAGPVPPGGKTLAPNIRDIRFEVSAAAGNHIITYLNSDDLALAPGSSVEINLGLYAGPLDRSILADEEPYKSLAMRGLILYQMSSFCAFCTFQWLAKLLISFLSLIHAVTFDWGIAIIALVLVVRTILHPITKKAQISMSLLGRQMQALKPEIEKLKQKYPNDPKRVQQEQMRLFREKGVNPLGCLGMVPLFLQMPIWIALYAMLFFAFELRHVPAFWGIFQSIPGWSFLADLSEADHFGGAFSQPVQILILTITGINILPVLMGVVFYFQQKYMTPPNMTLTPEQAQTQKIMKVMMVVMIPLVMYSAPSGLTLYMFTSSLFGILESRYIRAHIKQLGDDPFAKPAKPDKPKSRDPRARAFAAAMERIREQRKPKSQSFKKRRENE